MARKNPTLDKSTPKDEIVEGLDRLPITAGVNQKNVEIANAMPEVNMSKNDGDNPSIGDAPFANGKDIRVFSGGPAGQDPAPAKPGAK